MSSRPIPLTAAGQAIGPATPHLSASTIPIPLRSDRRFLVNQAVCLYAAESPERTWKAYIRDISRRGMQLVVEETLTLGTQVRIVWKGRTIHGTVRQGERRGSEHRLGIELSSSWESLVSEVLAQQAEELRESNAALQRADADVVAYAEALQRKNEELEIALHAAREASGVKSRFLASVSHELRTPLNCIIGFSQLLHDAVLGPVTGEQKDCLADMLRSSDHLLGLIDDILDLTKIESGKMVFNREVVALERLVNETLESLRPMAGEKQIGVRHSVDPAVAVVETDPARLKQVIFNYLSNALKFTPAGGSVTLRLLPEGAASYRVEVEDTGIGIRAEDIPRLFTEFGQLGLKADLGTGLGLVITKRIVEAQGGRVGVESEAGRGSRFYAVLPCGAGEPA